MSHPQDFSADVRNPVLFQGAALGVFHQVRHRSGATKLHHQLDMNKQKKLSAMKEQHRSQKNSKSGTLVDPPKVGHRDLVDSS